LKDHPDEDVRYSVAVGLTGDPDDTVAATLIELSADEDSDVRDWATFRLGMMEAGPPEVLGALVGRLADEDEDTRAEAIVGLSRRKDQRALEPLIECLNQLKAGEGQGYNYAEGLLYEAAADLKDPRLCPALLKLESRAAVYSSLSDAIETCGCKEQ
jgi:HEAT repeat protein